MAFSLRNLALVSPSVCGNLKVPKINGTSDIALIYGRRIDQELYMEYIYLWFRHFGVISDKHLHPICWSNHINAFTLAKERHYCNEILYNSLPHAILKNVSV